MRIQEIAFGAKLHIMQVPSPKALRPIVAVLRQSVWWEATASFIGASGICLPRVPHILYRWWTTNAYVCDLVLVSGIRTRQSNEKWESDLVKLKDYCHLIAPTAWFLWSQETNYILRTLIPQNNLNKESFAQFNLTMMTN